MNSWSGLPGVAGSNVMSYSKHSAAMQKKENHVMGKNPLFMIYC